MKYTPAPWRIKGQDIYGNELNGFICTWSGRTANAQLISAAPEMYEALKMILPHVTSQLFSFERTDIIETIKQAISKVEGGLL